MEYRTKEQIKKNMKANKCSGTSIERKLALAMWHSGIRYRKNPKNIFGKPDFQILPLKAKIVIFCDGEFWHGYDWEKKRHDFKTNKEFWITKIERNMERDKEVTQKLECDGWIVIRFPENYIRKRTNECVETIREMLFQRKMEDNYNGEV